MVVTAAFWSQPSSVNCLWSYMRQNACEITALLGRCRADQNVISWLKDLRYKVQLFFKYGY